jgi:hypothetical protein
MELQLRGFLNTTCGSRMRKKVFGIIGLVALGSFLTGCTSVQNYSLRSYQGPLPMADHQYVNPESYGVTAIPR